MNLQTMSTKVKLITGINQQSGSEQISDDEIERAIHQASAVVSRFFPRERIAQAVYNKSVSGESFTSSDDTAVTLANKPIRFGSETVTNAAATTTYTRDTDYEMDYINGTIKTLSIGSITTSTTHLISYDMDSSVIDISSLLTEPISIRAVDIVTAAEMPTRLEGWTVFGDFLTITNRGPHSQQPISDNSHIRIHYNALHTEPTSSGSGSFPRFLDELVIMGASGYALLIEVIEQMHQSFTDLASARTTIDNIAAIHTAIGTRVTSITAIHTLTDTALDVVAADIKGVSKSIMSEIDSALTELGSAATEIAKMAAESALANAALDNVAGELANANVESDKVAAEIAASNTNLDKAVAATTGPLDLAEAEAAIANAELDKADAELLLANGEADLANIAADRVATTITSSAAEIVLANASIDKVVTPVGLGNTQVDLVTAILDKMTTALDKVEEYIGAASSSADVILDTVVTEADLTSVALAAAVAELSSSTRNADGYLNTGDALINTVNVGADPAAENRRYAEAKTGMAQAYNQEAAMHVSDVNSRVTAANSRISMGTSFINEANGRAKDAESRIAQARAYYGEAELDLAEAQGYINTSQQYINTARDLDIGEARTRIATAEAFINVAQLRVRGGEAYTANAATYIAASDGLVRVSEGFARNADMYRASALSYIANAQGYVNEATQRNATAESYGSAAALYISNAQGYVAAADGRWKQIQGFLAEAQGRIDEINAYVAEIAQRIGQITQYINEANAYYTSSASVRESAELMRVEAENRIASFFTALRDRVQISTHGVTSANQQWADYGNTPLSTSGPIGFGSEAS